jgi:hypothetical protein
MKTFLIWNFLTGIAKVKISKCRLLNRCLMLKVKQLTLINTIFFFCSLQKGTTTYRKKEATKWLYKIIKFSRREIKRHGQVAH